MGDEDEVLDEQVNRGLADPREEGLQGVPAHIRNAIDYHVAVGNTISNGYANTSRRRAVDAAFNINDRTPDVEAFGNRALSMGFGESKYDNEISNVADLQDLDSFRAMQQSAPKKVLNGLGKMGTTAATTFLDSTIGLVWGIGSILYNGAAGDGWHFSHLYENDFGNLMREIEDAANEGMKNYQTEAEAALPWYRRLDTANFWADSVLANAGFVIGTAAAAATGLGAEKAIASKVISAFSKVGKAGGTAARTGSKAAVKSIAEIEGKPVVEGVENYLKTEKASAVIAQSLVEARQMASMNFHDWSEKAEQERNEMFGKKIKVISSNVEGLTNDFTEESANLLRKYGYDPEKFKEYSDEQKSLIREQIYRNELDNEYRRDEKLAADDLDRIRSMSNVDFMLQSILLMCTNACGNFSGYGSNFLNSKFNANVRRGMVNTLTRGKKGTRYVGQGMVNHAMKEAIAEGLFEEGGQSILDETAYRLYSRDFDPKQKSRLTEFFKTLYDVTKDKSTDANFWEEVAVGGFMATGGVVFPHKVMDKDGKEHWQIMQGGIFDKSVREQFKRNTEVANYLNSRVSELQKTGMNNFLVNRMSTEELKAIAAQNDDKFEFENLNYEQLMNDVMYFKSAGRLDDLKAMIGNPKANMSDKELENMIKMFDSVDEEGNVTNAMGYRDASGNIKAFSKEEKEEAKKKLAKKANDAYDMIKLVSDTMDDVDKETGFALDKKQVRLLTKLRVAPYTFTKRQFEMLREATDKYPAVMKTLRNAISNYNNLLGKYFDEVKDEDGKANLVFKEGLNDDDKRKFANNEIQLRNAANLALAMNETLEMAARNGELANNSMKELDRAKIELTDFGKTVKQLRLENGQIVETDVTIADAIRDILQNEVNKGHVDETEANEFLGLVRDMNLCNYYKNIYYKALNKFIKNPRQLRKIMDDIERKVVKRDVKTVAVEIAKKIGDLKKTYDVTISDIESNNTLSEIDKQYAKEAASRELDSGYANAIAGLTLMGDDIKEGVIKHLTSKSDSDDEFSDIRDFVNSRIEKDRFVSMFNGIINDLERKGNIDNAEAEMLSDMISNVAGTAKSKNDITSNNFFEKLKDYAANIGLNKIDPETWEIKRNEIGEYLDGFFQHHTDKLGEFMRANQNDLAAMAIEKHPSSVGVMEDTETGEYSIAYDDKGNYMLSEQGKRIVEDDAKRYYFINLANIFNGLLSEVEKYTNEDAEWGREYYESEYVSDIVDKLNLVEVVDSYPSTLNASGTSTDIAALLQDGLLQNIEFEKKRKELLEKRRIAEERSLFDMIALQSSNLATAIESFSLKYAASQDKKVFVDEEGGKASKTLIRSLAMIDAFVNIDEICKAMETWTKDDKDNILGLFNILVKNCWNTPKKTQNENKLYYHFARRMEEYEADFKKWDALSDEEKAKAEKPSANDIVEFATSLFNTKNKIVEFGRKLKEEIGNNVIENAAQSNELNVAFDMSDNNNDNQKTSLVEVIATLANSVKEDGSVSLKDIKSKSLGDIKESILSEGYKKIYQNSSRSDIRHIVDRNLGTRDLSEISEVPITDADAMAAVLSSAVENAADSMKEQATKTQSVSSLGLTYEDMTNTGEYDERERIEQENKERMADIKEQLEREKQAIVSTDGKTTTIQPIISQYDIKARTEDKVLVPLAQRYDEGDQNINFNPNEIHDYLVQCGAFKFVDNGGLKEWQRDPRNKYRNKIYIVTDEELNGGLNTFQGSRLLNDKNWYYMANDEKKDKSIPCYYTYENAEYFVTPKMSNGSVELDQSGRPVIGSVRMKLNSSQLKKENGKNVVAENDNTEISVKIKVGEEEREVKYTVAELIKAQLVKSVAQRNFFAVRLNDIKGAEPRFQIIGAVPPINLLKDKGISTDKFREAGDLQIIAMANMLSNRAMLDVLPPEIIAGKGVPLMFRKTFDHRITHYAKDTRNTMYTRHGINNLLGLYSTEAYYYYKDMPQEERLKQGIEVKQTSAYNRNAVEVTKGDKSYIFFDARPNVNEEINKKNFFFFNEDEEAASGHSMYDAYQNAAALKESFEEFKEKRNAAKVFISKCAEMYLSQSSEDYYEKTERAGDGDQEREYVKMSAFALDGYEVAEVVDGTSLNIGQDEAEVNLNDDKFVQTVRGRDTKVADLLRMGKVRLYVAVKRDRDGMYNFLSNAEGDNDTIVPMSDAERKYCFPGQVVLFYDTPSGKTRKQPLITSTYNMEKFAGDEILNKAFNDAASILMGAKDSPYIDNNSSRDNPIFKAFNIINEHIVFPLNKEIYSGKDNNGENKRSTLHVNYNAEDNSIDMSFDEVNVNIKLDSTSNVANELKKFVSGFDRKFNIKYTDIGSPETAAKLVERGMFKTTLTSINMIDSFVRIGRTDRDKSSEAAAKDRKIFRAVSDINRINQKLENLKRIEKIEMVNIGNEYFGYIPGRYLLVDSNGNDVSVKEQREYFKKINYYDENGALRIPGLNAVGFVDLLIAARRRYNANGVECYGRRKRCDIDDNMRMGILRISRGYLGYGNYQGFAYYDTVNGIFVSQNEFDNAYAIYGEDTKRATDGKVEVVEEVIQQQQDKQEKKDAKAEGKDVTPIKEEESIPLDSQLISEEMYYSDEFGDEAREQYDLFCEQKFGELKFAGETLERKVDNSVEYEKADLDKELEWLQEKLPWLPLSDRVRILKHLDNVVEGGSEAWGAFKDACMYLAENAAKGTVYHEAYHAVSQLCLDSKERLELYDEARRCLGSTMSNKDCEEYLAEKFREFVQSREDDGSLGKKIVSWFKELYQKIFHFKHYPAKMNELFRKINNGAYSRDLAVINGIYKSNATLATIGSIEDYRDYISSITGGNSGIAYTTDYVDANGNSFVIRPTAKSKVKTITSSIFNKVGRSVDVDTSVYINNEMYNGLVTPCIVNTTNKPKMIRSGKYKGMEYISTSQKPYILGSVYDVEHFKYYMNGVKARRKYDGYNKRTMTMNMRNISKAEFDRMPDVVKEKLLECI